MEKGALLKILNEFMDILSTIDAHLWDAVRVVDRLAPRAGEMRDEVRAIGGDILFVAGETYRLMDYLRQLIETIERGGSLKELARRIAESHKNEEAEHARYLAMWSYSRHRALYPTKEELVSGFQAFLEELTGDREKARELIEKLRKILDGKGGANE